MIEINKIHQGDCLELMKEIDDHVINMILCDLPYGVTQNKHDIPLNLNLLWEQYKRVICDKAIIALTSQFPFTIDLINSNRFWFRYDLIWNKILPTGFLNSNRMPLRVHEHILIFCNKLGTYNPQKTIGNKSHSKGKEKKNRERNYGKSGFKDNSDLLGSHKYPTSIINIQKPHSSIALHPTQKPLELFKYLIKTYSNKTDLILDNCMGSGTTAVACKQLGRNFIGMELSSKYIKIANKRLEQETLL